MTHTPFSGYVPAFVHHNWCDGQWAETPLAFARLFHALICLPGIRRINLNPYIPPAQLLCCNSRCSGAREGIKGERSQGY
jgi:hypothetical protein